MNHKLKALGLGLLATVVMGAISVMNASAQADPSGHFVSDSPTGTTAITGTQGGEIPLESPIPGLNAILCDEVSFAGTMEANTVGSITLTPKYAGCKTTGGISGETTFNVNGCHYTLTVGEQSTAHNTTDIVCPGQKKYISTIHQGCEIRIPAQTIGGAASGLAYTAIEQGGKHAITVEVTLHGFTVHLESGFCVLLGTVRTGSVVGSTVLEGFKDLGNFPALPHGLESDRVNITVTGSKG